MIVVNLIYTHGCNVPSCYETVTGMTVVCLSGSVPIYVNNICGNKLRNDNNEMIITILLIINLFVIYLSSLQTDSLPHIENILRIVLGCKALLNDLRVDLSARRTSGNSDNDREVGLN